MALTHTFHKVDRDEFESTQFKLWRDETSMRRVRQTRFTNKETKSEPVIFVCWDWRDNDVNMRTLKSALGKDFELSQCFVNGTNLNSQEANSQIAALRFEKDSKKLFKRIYPQRGYCKGSSKTKNNDVSLKRRFMSSELSTLADLETKYEELIEKNSMDVVGDEDHSSTVVET